MFSARQFPFRSLFDYYHPHKKFLNMPPTTARGGLTCHHSLFPAVAHTA